MDRVTDLVLAHLNDLIRETKELTDDPYLERFNEFVPAGDNPEQRDAVFVLRQIRQGLERYKKRLESRMGNRRVVLNEAKCIQLALQALIQGESFDKNDVKRFGLILPPDNWFKGDYPHPFDYQGLAQTDIRSHFNAKQ